jgi:hypothetical protein
MDGAEGEENGVQFGGRRGAEQAAEFWEQEAMRIQMQLNNEETIWAHATVHHAQHASRKSQERSLNIAIIMKKISLQEDIIKEEGHSLEYQTLEFA